MAVDIHSHGQTGNVGGAFLDVDGQGGGSAAEALRPDAKGIDPAEQFLQPRVQRRLTAADADTVQQTLTGREKIKKSCCRSWFK